jgi:single-stranded DNA-binding protein
MELKNVEIIRIGEIKTFGSGFACVEFVVKTDEQYPQTLQLQANKEKAENLVKYNKVGDKVDINVNLRGREWTNPQGEVKVFNTIEAWKIFKANSDNQTPQNEPFETVSEAEIIEDDGDLPF